MLFVSSHIMIKRQYKGSSCQLTRSRRSHNRIMSRSDQLSVIDSLAFDLELVRIYESNDEQKTFFYLRVHDLKELSATNNRINRVVSSKYFWKVIYERDFKTALPESDNVSPQHLYYIRSISSFLSIDRAKTMNNMLQQ